MSQDPQQPDRPDQQPEQYSQYPQQQPDYQQRGWAVPPAPPLNDAEAAPVQRPKSVDTSFLLWLIAAGLWLVSNLLSFVTSDALIAEMSEQLGQPVPAGEAGAGAVIFELVLLVLWVAVVFAMRAGQNWARILLTVLGSLAILVGLIQLLVLQYLFAIGALGVLQGLCNIASIVVLIVAIIYMFKTDSNRYFSRK